MEAPIEAGGEDECLSDEAPSELQLLKETPYAFSQEQQEDSKRG